MASRAEWSKRVKRWRSSGLTAKEFATREGYNPQTLSHWGWRLQREESQRRTERKGRTADKERTGSAGSNATPTMLELQPALFTPAESNLFVVELPCGTSVAVPMSFDGDALHRLMQVLGQAR